MPLQDAQITKQYLRQQGHLMLHGGILYRWVTPSRKEQNALQFVILQDYGKLCKDVMMTLDTWELIECLHWYQFYWPGMTKHVELHNANCE